MGNHANLGAFVADDSFLRHVSKKRHIADDGTIGREAFQPRVGEPTLSFTYQAETLRTDEALSAYQIDKKIPGSGDLPGICKLTYYDLTEALQPPLPPRFDEVPEDPKYGSLHYVTDIPKDSIHMEMMAKLATRNGVLRPFIKARKK